MHKPTRILGAAGAALTGALLLSACSTGTDPLLTPAQTEQTASASAGSVAPSNSPQPTTATIEYIQLSDGGPILIPLGGTVGASTVAGDVVTISGGGKTITGTVSTGQAKPGDKQAPKYVTFVESSLPATGTIAINGVEQPAKFAEAK